MGLHTVQKPVFTRDAYVVGLLSPCNNKKSEARGGGTVCPKSPSIPHTARMCVAEDTTAIPQDRDVQPTWCADVKITWIDRGCQTGHFPCGARDRQFAYLHWANGFPSHHSPRPMYYCDRSKTHWELMCYRVRPPWPLLGRSPPTARLAVKSKPFGADL